MRRFGDHQEPARGGSTAEAVAAIPIEIATALAESRAI
jgi:hypothetical protein